MQLLDLVLNLDDISKAFRCQTRAQVRSNEKLSELGEILSYDLTSCFAFGRVKGHTWRGRRECLGTILWGAVCLKGQFLEANL